ncbi:hypothetical protein [Streptomyces sp. V1I1]|uniref:hypothetical protein n=1 Tax=Streptomyces sp. V1I1 TaxID=3042272 RepID=UPI002786DDF8|nr:hypothetical protein [Streptomyces sp. V1I1]MDQ0943151.1 hypothetical protein [Streptomyces sp. V1I1]
MVPVDDQDGPAPNEVVTLLCRAVIAHVRTCPHCGDDGVECYRLAVMRRALRAARRDAERIQKPK